MIIATYIHGMFVDELKHLSCKYVCSKCDTQERGVAHAHVNKCEYIYVQYCMQNFRMYATMTAIIDYTTVVIQS